MKTSS
ncbi:hypothetical protein D027_4242A, partial [Vibrio parahaemolyticus 861]